MERKLTLHHTKENIEGQVKWQSPSNIALVKYWGKYGRQLPKNASVSFTLKNARTEMAVQYKKGSGKVVLYFETKRNEAFEKRIEKFIKSVVDISPFLKELDYEIYSTNTFPHSAGIASSASAMSALCSCLCDIENQLFKTLEDESVFRKKASELSRLASGSAARSVYPVLAMWGKHKKFKQSSDLYAIDVSKEANPIFHTFKNSILIASSKEKSVSSSAGHQLMENNPFANVRFEQANKNLNNLMQAMKNADMDNFIRIVEEEALTLHALMMTSNPSFILMQPNTITLINKLRAFRLETKLPVCFTLDAGPNLHVLYPKSITKEVQQFIKTEMKPFCENGLIIEDEVGMGSSRCR